MPKRRIIGLGALSLLTAALVTGFTLGGQVNSAAGAVSRGQEAAATAASKPGQAQLMDSLVTHFAARLGVDEAKLTAAYVDAVSDTVDQAVKDGKLTREQAGKIKAQARSGLRGVLTMNAKKQWAAGTDAEYAWEAAWKAAAAMLGLETGQMKQELRSGKSLGNVARERNVDAQQLQERMLAEGKAVLDAAVRDGKLNQPQANNAYRELIRKVSEIISMNKPVQDKSQSMSKPVQDQR